MKKWIGYAVILLPIIAVAFKWQVWDGGIGAWVLAFIALFNCTVWGDIYHEQSKKKRNRQDH